MDPMPTIPLKSGLRIANFSSPHAFRFTDGSILPACSPERANLGKLMAVESTTDRGAWTDIDLDFQMSYECEEMLNAAAHLWASDAVDIVIVPLPVLKAYKAIMGKIEPTEHPFRTIRSADRVNKINHHDRFCV